MVCESTQRIQSVDASSTGEGGWRKAINYIQEWVVKDLTPTYGTSTWNDDKLFIHWAQKNSAVIDSHILKLKQGTSTIDITKLLTDSTGKDVVQSLAQIITGLTPEQKAQLKKTLQV